MSDPAAGPLTERVEVVVHGRVQGVGYRMFAGYEAVDRDLVGWVGNEPDGSVRCVAEGRRDLLEEFVRVLREGPPAAVINDVDVAWTRASGEFERFAIRSGWHSGD